MLNVLGTKLLDLKVRDHKGLLKALPPKSAGLWKWLQGAPGPKDPKEETSLSYRECPIVESGREHFIELSGILASPATLWSFAFPGVHTSVSGVFFDMVWWEDARQQMRIQTVNVYNLLPWESVPAYFQVSWILRLLPRYTPAWALPT